MKKGMKPYLLMLVDSEEYIRGNCYQGQLAEKLEEHFQVKMMSLRWIKLNLPFSLRPGRFDHVLSVLRLRTLADNLDVVERFVRDTPLYVYEQDAWQAFMDDSPWKGSYQKIQDKLNVKSFLVTSKWWRDFVRARGIRAEFVRMGMLPRYCDAGPLWAQRDISLGFQGTVHPHRKVLFDYLSAHNHPVTVLPSRPYQEFLQTIQKMRIYIHTEDDPWRVDGQMLPRNALWIKDTEAAARGTFAIRNWDEDAESYNIGELPTIFTYKDIKNVPALIEQIGSMPEDEKNRRMKESADRMRERDDWMTVINTIMA